MRSGEGVEREKGPTHRMYDWRARCHTCAAVDGDAPPGIDECEGGRYAACVTVPDIPLKDVGKDGMILYVAAISLHVVAVSQSVSQSVSPAVSPHRRG